MIENPIVLPSEPEPTAQECAERLRRLRDLLRLYGEARVALKDVRQMLGYEFSTQLAEGAIKHIMHQLRAAIAIAEIDLETAMENIAESIAETVTTDGLGDSEAQQ